MSNEMIMRNKKVMLNLESKEFPFMVAQSMKYSIKCYTEY